jgi:membrane protease YdiL (CAAX protease family)
MNGPPGAQGSWWIDAAALAFLVATLAPWVWIVRRLVARRPVLPYQPRRPVPWGALDIVLVVLFFFGVAGFVSLCERPLLDRWAEARYGGHPAAEGSKLEHSLILVLAADPSLLTIAICFFSAVVVAPIAEEVFFRLLLQGWLEKLERRLRRPIPILRRLTPGVFSIVVASMLFAAGHFRAAPLEGEAPDVVLLFHGIVVMGVASLLAVVLGFLLVRTRTGATDLDLGFVPGKFWADVRLGLVAALAVVGPIEWLQAGLQRLLETEWMQELLQRLDMPPQVAADPVTIFVFAAALGTLYCRTHRIVPGITLHVALNLTSLTMWLLGAT